MPSLRLTLLTLLTLCAFAGNSLLCRAALSQTSIDAASFTSLRLMSGALMLGLIARLNRQGAPGRGNWLSGLALWVYAAGFSLSYLQLSTAMGALILFGAVQFTMIGVGLVRGERLTLYQWLGLVLAFGGLVGLLLPGLAAPPLVGALLMLSAGIAWGIYSLRGRKGGDPLRVNAGNFLYALVPALLFSLIWPGDTSWDYPGIGYALASGALASGIGYAIWYRVLPELKASTAASVQLSVPVLASLGGIVFLGESLSLRLVLASIAILGGILLVILARTASKS
ncbi:DMT family transporter [Shewanella sedimentimangrovi]|uniref:DMT family transporter n=1 Tax=Shewanella sedimentimangrovi TaxID=2814293 RepID=A0ABX7R2Y8_9GAMM|nr:DMT family transporter [Shewanella sedimentimangrovi]QSX37193.1 DMT family transporter [Shewanella sedimentimangrovi]